MVAREISRKIPSARRKPEGKAEPPVAVILKITRKERLRPDEKGVRQAAGAAHRKPLPGLVEGPPLRLAGLRLSPPVLKRTLAVLD